MFFYVLFIFNSAVKEKAYTLWIDNFSKIRKFQIPHLNIGVWRDCLWTGFALRQHKGADIDMSILRNQDQEVIPAMPDDPFEFELSLKTIFRNRAAKDVMQLSNSNVNTWKVNNVPLKPIPVEADDDEPVPPLYLAKILEDPDKLDNLFPEKIVEENIGSNVGFCQIFRKVYDDHEMDVDNVSCKYLALNLDCNIFDRLVKVMFLIFQVSLILIKNLFSLILMKHIYVFSYSTTDLKVGRNSVPSLVQTSLGGTLINTRLLRFGKSLKIL
jgi:hypothetical protein